MRFRFIDAERAGLAMPIFRLCRLLQVSVSGFYAWRNRGPSQRQLDDMVLLAHVRAAFRRSRESYGAERVHHELAENGIEVGRHRVARLMRGNGLSPKRKQKFKKTTDSQHNKAVASNLLDQNFSAEAPNEKWAADISYIWTAQGWLYLAVMLDLYSRRVIGWAVGARMTSDLPLRALNRAIGLRQPGAGVIHHSDRGSQYCSDAYQARLGELGFLASMSGKGNCYDNAVVETFFKTIKSYHRAECLTHVGDSQAVRSLTQCGEPMRFAMAAPIDLRNDFDSVSLRRLAKRTRDATQSRRLLALAEVYDGGSRTDASRIGGVGLQIIRDWVLRFNARGPDGLVDGKSPGAPSKLNADHRRALAEVVEAGPVPAVDGVVRWRRKDLARWLLGTFAISLDETTVGRELKALGFAKISARPRHYAQNELAVEAFKKNFPAELAKIRARLPKGVEIELWWQDEARIGQKNKLTRRWARRGTRPRAPRDQRTEWAYIFGAICPAKGKGAGLVMPWCDTDAMAAHLIEISAAVDPGAHAVLIVDQAGWHLTPKLAIPDNITVLALPPRSPELNPVENVWQFMRDNWLSNQIFKSYEDIVALCCQAWNNLIDQPWKIMSLGMRKWAHGF